MIKNVVLYSSGIVRKQVEEFEQINDFKTYLLKEQLNDLHAIHSPEEQERFKKNMIVLAEVDNHLFFTGYFYQIEDIKKYNYNSEQIIKQLTEQFNEGLAQHKRVSLGMAQYLKREDEYRMNEEFRKQQEQNRKLERQRLEEEKKQQEEQEYNKELDKAEIALLEGKAINNLLLLDLFDRHNITLPLRTRGWVLNKLISISQTNYRSYGNSTKIFDYVEELVDKLKEARKTV